MDEIGRLQSEAESLSSKVSVAEKEKDSLQQQLSESQQNVEHLKEELDRTTHELEEKNQSLLDISQRRDILQEDLNQLDLQQETERSHLLESKEAMQIEIDALKNENKGLLQECEERRRALEEKALFSESSAAEIEKLSDALARSAEKMDKLAKEKDKRLGELKTEIDVEREKFERLEESSMILTKCNKLLVEEKVALEQKLQRVKAANVSGGDEASEAIAKMEEDCSELKRHGDRLQEKCSELESTLAKTQHEKVTLREELSRKTTIWTNCFKGYMKKKEKCTEQKKQPRTLRRKRRN